MTRVLVTGAAGFIGSHTVERLLSEGAEVCGVDNLRTGSLDNLKGVRTNERFHWEEVDIVDRDAMRRVMTAFRPTAIIHLAALVSVPESIVSPDLNYRINVEGVHSVGMLAKEFAVKQVVFASSSAVYGDTDVLPVRENNLKSPISPYGAAKFAGESLLQSYARNYGFGCCCFRYFNVYGPRQDPSSPYSGVISIFAQRSMSQQAVTIYGDGTQTRDFVFVADVAKVNVKAALQTDGVVESINVGTGVASSLLDLVGAFKERFPDAPEPEFAEARAGDILQSYTDPATLKQRLGVVPRYDLRTGLGELIASLSPAGGGGKN